MSCNSVQSGRGTKIRVMAVDSTCDVSPREWLAIPKPRKALERPKPYSPLPDKTEEYQVLVWVDSKITHWYNTGDQLYAEEAEYWYQRLYRGERNVVVRIR